MAHHFPVENDERGNEPEALAQQQQTASSGHSQILGAVSLQPTRHRHHTGSSLRSSPIAIIRTPEDQKRHPDSSDDEDGESTIDAHDAKDSSSTRTSRSLPSHLLRAPRLGSVPSNDEYWVDRYPTMLPPAVQSSEQPLGGSSAASRGASRLGDDRVTSYGSLRDSHQRGRFLDGPSSYRDKRTGDIRRIQHRVRFQEIGTESTELESLALSSLSIGERIMKSRQKQSASRKDDSKGKKKEPTSSLAALLEASPASGPEPEPVSDVHANILDDGASGTRTSTFYDEDNEINLPTDMLSTSLTGLEVLQAGLRPGDQGTASTTQTDASTTTFGTAEELPRDANGRNTLLSRSFSDPTPHIHRGASPSLEGRTRVLALHGTPTSSGTVATSVPPLQLDPPTNLTQAPVTYQIQVHDRLEDLHNAPDHNPDTDFAFDLEME